MAAGLELDLTDLFARHPDARRILERLGSRGHTAVLVGGAVRDLLRSAWANAPDLLPAELDLATDATPDQVRALFSDWRTVEVGKAFGVVVLRAPGGAAYEVATFRQEGDYDGRKPGTVELVRSLERDVRRRDFTVNGLAARLDGTVLDHVGGVADLKRGLVRTIGDPDARFREDFLRLLRAVRFACALAAEIEPGTAAAIRRHAGGLRRISRERVGQELFKLLGTAQSRRGIELLEALGLLAQFLPELPALQGVPQPARYHPEGDVWVHTLLALDWADRLRLPPLSKLAVLLHDVGKPSALARNAGAHMGEHEKIGAEMVEEIARRLRLSAAEAESLQYTTREHLRIAKLPEMGRAKRLRFLKAQEDASAPLDKLPERFPRYAELLRVLLCDAQASAHRSSAWLPVLRASVDAALQVRDLEALEAAQKLLDGHDVLALGVAPGPAVGAILASVYDRIFAGEIRDRPTALAAARRLARRAGA